MLVLLLTLGPKSYPLADPEFCPKYQLVLIQIDAKLMFPYIVVFAGEVYDPTFGIYIYHHKYFTIVVPYFTVKSLLDKKIRNVVQCVLDDLFCITMRFKIDHNYAYNYAISLLWTTL